MSNRSRGLAVSCMIVQLAMCDKVLAEEPAKEAYWELRGGLTAKAGIELAKTGAPIWYTVNTEDGSTLRQVVAEVCGQQPADVLNVLLTEAERLNVIKGPDEVIQKGVAVAVPFCIKVEQDVPIEIQSGDTLEKILNENYGVSGPKTLDKIYKTNKAEFNARSFDDFVTNLTVGKKILVPMAEPRVFSPRSDAETTESVPVGSTLPSTVRTSVESVATPVSQPPPQGPQFETIESVEFEDAEANCAPAGSVASVVDFKLLTQRFAIEEQAKKDFDGGQANPVVVGIIDSGLGEVGDNFFKAKYFAPNPKEFKKRPAHDDDGNGFEDDIYGMNLTTNNGEIRPYPTSGNMRSHGTKMAALLLGGPLLADWADARTSPIVRLKVVNFASGMKPGANMDPPYLGNAIQYLVKQGAQIINMSLSGPENVAPATNGIRDSADVLFVVAAGNSKTGPGRNIDLKPLVYPARYGGRIGDHRNRLMTVAAADLNGKRANFSNYSNQYVDLLAPGCAVETRDDLGATVLDNGTSPATAIASFAAALVASLGLTDPHAIKNRLLLSTDHDPDLSGSAWASGRLNIVKAISLRNDVVGTKSSGYKFLKVAADNLKRFCGDEAARSALSDIRKVVPNIPVLGGANIEFWIEIGEGLERVSCPQDNAPDAGHIMLSDGTRGPSLTDVQDITLATF